MSNDDGLLLDMLQAARTVVRYLEGRDEAAFLADAMLQDAVMLQLAVIGEAGRRVSQPFRDAHPSIPWAKMDATRNVVVHAYGRVALDKIWSAASQGIPALILELEPLVLPDDGVTPATMLTPRETP